MFDIHPTKSYGLTNDYLFKTKGKIPVVANSSIENGIGGWVDLKPTEKGNMVVYSDTTTSDSIFYQPFDFVGYSHVQGLYAFSENWNELSLLYFVTDFRKSSANKFNYGNKFTRQIAADMKVVLPTTKSGEIDFQYMERYIQRTTNSILENMNTFLKENNLLGSVLSSVEKKAIEDFDNDKIKFSEFRIGDLFEAQTGDVDLQQKDCNGKGHFLINSGLDNIGIKGRTDRKAKVFSANTITIDFWGNAYYRNFEYKMATHNHVFSLSGDCIRNENVGLYLVSRLSYMKNVFSYSSMGTWTRIKEMGISLPVNHTNEIDYGFMENYISAQKKLAILPIVISSGRENKTEYQINSSYGTRNVAEK